MSYNNAYRKKFVLCIYLINNNYYYFQVDSSIANTVNIIVTRKKSETVPLIKERVYRLTEIT